MPYKVNYCLRISLIYILVTFTATDYFNIPYRNKVLVIKKSDPNCPGRHSPNNCFRQGLKKGRAYITHKKIGIYARNIGMTSTTINLCLRPRVSFAWLLLRLSCGCPRSTACPSPPPSPSSLPAQGTWSPAPGPSTSCRTTTIYVIYI